MTSVFKIVTSFQQFQSNTNTLQAMIWFQVYIIWYWNFDNYNTTIKYSHQNWISIFTNPTARAGYHTRFIFKQNLTGLIPSFPSPRLVASPRLKNQSALLFTIFTNPSARAGYDTRSVFKRSLTGFNSEFSFSTSCHTKAEEPSQPYYLPIAGGRIIGFIPFPRVLVLCEMQSA